VSHVLQSGHRPRHAVGHATLLLLRPLFRHSYSRRAWILRGVGEHRGPVLVDKTH
jgi:hypothetical protein